MRCAQHGCELELLFFSAVCPECERTTPPAPDRVLRHFAAVRALERGAAIEIVRSDEVELGAQFYIKDGDPWLRIQSTRGWHNLKPLPLRLFLKQLRGWSSCNRWKVIPAPF